MTLWACNVEMYLYDIIMILYSLFIAMHVAESM